LYRLLWIGSGWAFSDVGGGCCLAGAGADQQGEDDAEQRPEDSTIATVLEVM
jgi:hypothetical protein